MFKFCCKLNCIDKALLPRNTAWVIISLMLGVIAGCETADHRTGQDSSPSPTEEIVSHEDGNSRGDFSDPDDETFSIIEIPPSPNIIDSEISEEVMSVLQPTFFKQDPVSSLALILSYHRVKYAIIYQGWHYVPINRFVKRTAVIDSQVHIAEFDPRKLESVDKNIPFLTAGEGWYKASTYDTELFQWMGHRGSLNLYLPESSIGQQLVLKLSVRHAEVPAELEVQINGNQKITRQISSTFSELTILLEDTLPGRNSLTFTSKSACHYDQQSRCITFAFKDIELSKSSAL